ncbi:uncharacterized protein LOC119720466 [Patiria miniata]|uniref:EGF-like domain-containing protein n=1 Tax=Patiria miniata TaxID=46514 RepID=A0A913Z4Y0_PATMI|nr:uncharacterized protein LOC119720466 [Patiria miniata]
MQTVLDMVWKLCRECAFIANRIPDVIIIKLRGYRSTDRVTAVTVLSLEEGSVVAQTALAFKGQEPSVDVISNVIAANDTLNDGFEDIGLVPDSVSYTNTSLLSDCTQDGCMNGGTCESSGFSPQPTCSCPASFTGERCETAVTTSPPDLTTETPTTEGGGGVSPLATVLIIVGCVVLLLVIVGIVIWCCMRRKYLIKSEIYHQSSRRLQASREPIDFEDRRDRSLSSDESDSVAGCSEEERRINRLAHVMSRSPFLHAMQSNSEFIRPYMVSGNEALERYREEEARH